MQFRKFLRPIGLLLAAGAIVAAYSVLPLMKVSSPSPDEASNLFFSKSFTGNGSLWVFEGLNLKAPGLVHPRSVRVVDDLLVPGGFLGLPVIYGCVAVLAGVGVIPFLTPIVAVLGLAAWYGLVKEIFGKRVAVFAVVLLAVNPVWWYAASRTMMPNVLFVTLVLGALFMGVARPFKTMIERSEFQGAHLLRRADPAIAGIFLALAVAVRPAELYWLAIAGAIVAWPLVKDAAGWRRLAVMLVSAALTIAPFLMLHQITYGNMFASGYGNGLDVPVGAAMQGRGNALLGPLRPYLFPLGFAPMNALHNGYAYGLALFPWWTLAVVAGLAVVARSWKAHSDAVRRFFVAYAALAAWLVLFYGSWVIQDNPDPNAITIGSSYLRYWLPIFVGSTVPVALLVGNLADRIKEERRRTLCTAVMLAVFALAGGLTVVFAKGEGLRALIAVDARYKNVVAEIRTIVPLDKGLIIADRADKYFLGERAVMSPLRAQSTYDALPMLVANADVYYFGITLPEKDLEYLRGTVLAPRKLTIDPVRTFDHETLYRITPLP